MVKHLLTRQMPFQLSHANIVLNFMARIDLDRSVSRIWPERRFPGGAIGRRVGTRDPNPHRSRRNTAAAPHETKPSAAMEAGQQAVPSKHLAGASLLNSDGSRHACVFGEWIGRDGTSAGMPSLAGCKSAPGHQDLLNSDVAPLPLAVSRNSSRRPAFARWPSGVVAHHVERSSPPRRPLPALSSIREALHGPARPGI